MTTEAALPLEHFIQAVQSQLDKAQTAMAVKARNLNLPMTFAVRDINMDLRAHVEFSHGEVRIRPAAANEQNASVFHVVFSAITKPMIEENAVAFTENPEEQMLDDLEEELTEEERRRLEWVGVRTVSKLREMDQRGASNVVGRVTNLPVSRLRQALQRASEPSVSQVMPVDPAPHDPPDLRRILKVRGRNLVREGVMPNVTIANRRAAIVKSSENELLLAPDDEQWAGVLRIETEPELAASMSFDLRPFAPSSVSDVCPEGEDGETETGGKETV